MTVDAGAAERLGIRDYYRVAAPGIIAGVVGAACIAVLAQQVLG
ncbi:MAG TPA: hypothetical protein VFA83_13515 [Acidimicrobiales bacterium]|nr:hypothetical protein [Acidimicrobiales bacterium]